MIEAAAQVELLESNASGGREYSESEFDIQQTGIVISEPLPTDQAADSAAD
jgi:hypothetical protein